LYDTLVQVLFDSGWEEYIFCGWAGKLRGIYWKEYWKVVFCVLTRKTHSVRYLSHVKVILRPTVIRPVRLGPSGTCDQFFPFSLWLFFFDSFGFVDVGCPLWREVGSVLSSFCWASPAQPIVTFSINTPLLN
jgi:hypothetical protein